MSAVDYTKPTLAVGSCDRCGGPVIADEGYVRLIQPASIRHTSCSDAAYRRGKRDGYADAVRQLKEARKALKAGWKP